MKTTLKKISIATAIILTSQLALAAEIIEKPSKVKKAIANTTIDFSGGKGVVVEYFAADGTARGRSNKNGVFTGKWFVRPDATLCVVHDDPNQSGCVFVLRRKHEIEFHRFDDVLEGPFPIVKGNPNRL
jgi:hypothetical protein